MDGPPSLSLTFSHTLWGHLNKWGISQELNPLGKLKRTAKEKPKK
jgi:hypothetical protein